MFKNSKGEDIGATSLMALCRCGGSNTKPYCDGTHLRNGFTDTKESDREPDRVDTYVGKHITIHDNRGVCAHRGYCTDELPSVFRRGEMISISPRRYSADGPYDVTGEIELDDPDGEIPESKEHYTLCRCGASKNKPFCSGEHWYIKLIDDDN